MSYCLMDLGYYFRKHESYFDQSDFEKWKPDQFACDIHTLSQPHTSSERVCVQCYANSYGLNVNYLWISSAH